MDESTCPSKNEAKDSPELAIRLPVAVVAASFAPVETELAPWFPFAQPENGN